jgi:hypothetical protein
MRSIPSSGGLYASHTIHCAGTMMICRSSVWIDSTETQLFTNSGVLYSLVMIQAVYFEFPKPSVTSTSGTVPITIMKTLLIYAPSIMPQYFANWSHENKLYTISCKWLRRVTGEKGVDRGHSKVLSYMQMLSSTIVTVILLTVSSGKLYSNLWLVWTLEW